MDHKELEDLAGKAALELGLQNISTVSEPDKSSTFLNFETSDGVERQLEILWENLGATTVPTIEAVKAEIQRFLAVTP